MTNIKKGDILQYKNSTDTKIVLGIADGLYAVSYTYDTEAVYCWYTEKGMKDLFIIPEEKWTPANNEGYYYPDIGNVVKSYDFAINNLYILDEYRIKHNLCFKTKEEAIECVNKMLNAIK